MMDAMQAPEQRRFMFEDMKKIAAEIQDHDAKEYGNINRYMNVVEQTPVIFFSKLQHIGYTQAAHPIYDKTENN